MCIGEKNNDNNFIGISPFRLCNKKYNECLKKVLIWKKWFSYSLNCSEMKLNYLFIKSEIYVIEIDGHKYLNIFLWFQTIYYKLPILVVFNSVKFAFWMYLSFKDNIREP